MKTNFELIQEMTPREFAAKVGGCGTCLYAGTKKCEKSQCKDGIMEWLESSTLLIGISEDERTILENLNYCYNYIARDRDNTLCVFENKPGKMGDSYWSKIYEESRSGYLSGLNHLFKFITFDEGPFNIQELLKLNKKWGK